MYDHVLLYGLPFVVSLCISATICFLIIKIYQRINFRDVRTESRHIHDHTIARFGGCAIIISFIVTLFIDQHLVFDHIIWALVCGGVAIFFFGLVDDLKSLEWKSQIFFQIALVLMVFMFGVRVVLITNPFGGVFYLINDHFVILSLIFMIVWMLYIMNAMNWADGIDGLSGGIAFIAAFALFMIALDPHVNQPPIAIVASIFAGSVAGFIFFNYPKAQIFAGSSGSFFMGFVLATLAIAAGAKIGTTLLVLGVPILDMLWVIFCRIRAGRSIFYPDQEHLHYKLLHRGWGVKRILFLYYGITMICAIAAITTRSVDKLVIFVGMCSVVLGFFVMFSYKKQHKTLHVA